MLLRSLYYLTFYCFVCISLLGCTSIQKEDALTLKGDDSNAKFIKHKSRDLVLKKDTGNMASKKLHPIFRFNIPSFDYRYSLSDPLLENNTIVLLHTSGDIVAYNQDFRRQIWKNHFFKKKSQPFSFGGMSCSDETIYITTGSRDIAAINLTNGDIKWNIELDNNTRGKPLIHKDKIFIQAIDSSIYAINKDTGSIIWKCENDHNDIETIIESNQLIFARNGIWAKNSFGVIKINPENGKIIDVIASDKLSFTNSVNAFGITDRRLILDNDIIYTLDGDDIVAIDTEKSEILWRSNKINIASEILAYNNIL